MPSASVLRTLPPRSPRGPPLKSPSQFHRERSSNNLGNKDNNNNNNSFSNADDAEVALLVDPSPQHLPAHLPPVMDADLAETRGDFVVSPDQQPSHESLSSAPLLSPSSSFSSSSSSIHHSGGNKGSSSEPSSGSHSGGDSGSASETMGTVTSAPAAPASSWCGNKVTSFDVASVGNASDTGIPWYSRQGISTTTTGRALHENAKLALNAGNYDTALALFQAILQAQRKRFGKCHASVAAAMHNVGVCLQRMGQHAMAEDLLVEAVQMREKTLGRNDVEIAASLSKLGSVRISLSKFEEAFHDLRRALSIAKTHAAAQQQQQQQQEASSLTSAENINPALSPSTNNHGAMNGGTTPITNTTNPTDSNMASNKTVAQMLCHLACLYFETGEFFAAQATFQDALDIYRQVWSATAHETDKKTKNALMLQLTDTLCNIGSVLNRRKCFAQAIGNFQEALDLLRGIVEHDHPRIISTLDNLAYSYSKNKEYARAVTCYRAMLRAQVSQSGTFTEECLATFRKRVIMYDKLRLTTEAINDTRDLMRIQKTYLPDDDPIMEETRFLLEELQLKKKKERKKQQQGPPGPEEC